MYALPIGPIVADLSEEYWYPSGFHVSCMTPVRAFFTGHIEECKVSSAEKS